MRVRHYRIRKDIFEKLFRIGDSKNYRVVQGLPPDASIRGAFSETGSDFVVLVVESARFESVGPLADPPPGEIVLEEIAQQKEEKQNEESKAVL